MKMSFIIGWAALFVSLLFFDTIVQQSSGIGSEQFAYAGTLLKPDITNMTAPGVGQLISLVTQVGQYLVTFILMLGLWFPSIWVGNWLWFYWFFCFPVTMGFIVSIVFMLRGVGSS